MPANSTVFARYLPTRNDGRPVIGEGHGRVYRSSAGLRTQLTLVIVARVSVGYRAYV